MNHLWGSKCEKVSELSSQKILDRIDNFYSVNFSKQTDELPFWKWSSTFDPYFKRAILASNSPSVPLLFIRWILIYLQNMIELWKSLQKKFLNVFWWDRHMFYMTCKCIVSHNYMHPKGTEMIFFEEI